MKDQMRLCAAIAAIAVSLVGLCSGCGDDDAAPIYPDASLRRDTGVSPPPDAGVPGDDAGPAEEDAGGEPPADGGDWMPPVECAVSRLLVTTSDFATGGLGVLDLSSGAVRRAEAPLADQDSVPAVAGCTTMLLERGAGRALVQSGDDPLVTSRAIDVDPPGATPPYASNPQRVVAVSDTRAYVVRLATSSLLIVDVTRDGDAARIGEIDLSLLAAAGDPDSVDATDAILAGDRVYVALGRYYYDVATSGLVFPEGSALAVIDARTGTLVDTDPAAAGVQGIALTLTNPWRGLSYDAAHHRLLVGAGGNFGALDGGIEVVDLAAMRSDGAIVTESALGADLESFVADGTSAFVSAGGDVRVWDPTSGALGAVVVEGGARAILEHEGTLYVAYSSSLVEGVRTFDAESRAETTPAAGPYSFGPLPIYGWALVP